MIATTRVSLPGLMPSESLECERCLSRLERFLGSLGGVAGVHVNPNTRVAILHFDTTALSPAAIDAAIRREGERLQSTFEHQNWPVDGMDCADCALTLERGVSRLPGVQWASVNFAGARMAVEYDTEQTDTAAIARRVNDLGYRLVMPEASAAEAEPGALRRLLAERRNVMTAIGAVLALLGAVTHLAGAPRGVWVALLAAAMVVAGLPVARKGFATVRATHRLDINVLMAIAAVGAAILGQWGEGAAVVVLFSLGEALEGYTMDRARRSIRAVMRLAPQEAIVRDAAGERRVPVETIVTGDIVVVRPGQRVPVDGAVVSGTSALDQAPITGESIPVEKAAGDEVFAGSVNGTGVLTVRATRPASDSTLARIIRMVEEAQGRRAPTQRFVDRFAAVYTPVVVAGAALLAVAPPLLGLGSWGEWVYRALVLLVIACPCALVISTPVSIVSALASAARHGVLVKGGAYLEAAGSLRALAFDKTGTLTEGRPAVTSVIPLGGWDADALLSLAAQAERYSEHPLGAAIVREAEVRGLPTAAAVADVQAHTGHGIEARVDGRLVRAGTPDWVHQGRLAPRVAAELAALEAAGVTPVLVRVDDELAGFIGLADRLRPEAPAAVARLRDAGIGQTVMLTGDRAAVAQAIAQAAGVEKVKAELLPHEKVRAVEELLEEHGSVGMVGDGVNDAPALARATVGIAMGAAGSDTALETADVALMSDDLSKVGYLIDLSRSTRRIIGQNIGLSLAIKLVILVLAVGGTATLWEAVFADVGAALIVIANGMRLLRS